MKKTKSLSTECQTEANGEMVRSNGLNECTVCKASKPVSEFGRDNRKRNGLKSACRDCSNASVRRWRKNNPERAAEIDAKQYYADPEKARAASRAWYWENKEKANDNAKLWREENPDKVRDWGREYARKWRADNPERAKEKARQGQKRRRENPINRLEDAFRNGIYRGIRGQAKSGRTFDLLGYTIAELIAHLEQQFTNGMTWENYGEWHVDHIRPLASFSYQSAYDQEFKAAWSLDNLQPLWAYDNFSKGARYKADASNDNGETNAPTPKLSIRSNSRCV